MKDWIRSVRNSATFPQKLLDSTQHQASMERKLKALGYQHAFAVTGAVLAYHKCQ